VGLFMAFALAKVVQVRRKPVEVGMNTMVGTSGVVRRDGYVLAHGELWRARSADGEDLRAGEPVEVEAVEDGLQLVVRRQQATERVP
jgi:membrane-bound serine protease (ClpP class)